MIPSGCFPEEHIARARRITTLLLDVDGVMTDGRIIYAEHGDELKNFNVKDGAGLIFWNRLGLKSGIITARKSRIIKRRARELHVDYLEQGSLLKLAAYERMLKRLGIEDGEVCAIGDDLMELPILRRAGFSVSVPGAVDEIKSVSHYVTRRRAGHGAVREVIDHILKIKGVWDGLLERYH